MTLKATNKYQINNTYNPLIYRVSNGRYYHLLSYLILCTLIYLATETAVADMILCKPFQQFIDTNHPGTDIKIGLYRTVVEAEKNVNPENRMKANA